MSSTLSLDFYCKFCGEKCVLGEYDHVYSTASTIYECHRHPLVVKHYLHITSHKSGDCDGPNCCPRVDWHATIIHIRWYRGKSYCANWFPGNERYPGPRFRLDSMGPESNVGHVLFEVPFHPADVTPENLLQKLPTWLTFY